jgi:hypothetical protein
MSDQDESALDDRDLFGVFGLSRHFDERVAALRAAPVGLVEFVKLLDDRQLWLRLGTMTGARRTAIFPRRLVARATPALRLVAEQGLVAADQELFQEFELQLGGRSVRALQTSDLLGQIPNLFVESQILALEQDRGLTQRVLVVDLLDAEHERSTSQP